MTRLRAAVLSAGAWSTASHLPSLMSDGDVDLLAVTGRDEQRAGDIAARFGARRATSDWRSVLDEGPDVVIVSSPPVAHEEQVIAALESGAHVLCEKPFAIEPSAAWRMARAGERARGELLVAFAWSLTPAFQRIRELVLGGAIGALEHVVLSVAVNIRELLTAEPDVGWEDGVHSYRSTYQDPSISGGGAAAVTLSHGFGLLEFITGRPLRRLSARTWPIGTRIDLHDGILAEFDTADDGPAPTCVISATSTHRASRGVEWHVGLYGDRGELWYDSAAARLRMVHDDGTVDERELAVAPAPSPTEALLSVARGADVPVGCGATLAANAVEATDAVYRSDESGTWAVLGGPVGL